MRPKLVEAEQLRTGVTVTVEEPLRVAMPAAPPAAEFAIALISVLVRPKELALTASRAAEFKLI